MSCLSRRPRGSILRSAAPILVAASLGVATNAPAEQLDLAGVKVNVIERKLDNGLTLLMVENHQSPTIGMTVQFAVGSVDEWDGISGSAHILEHLLFKGTADLGSTDWAREKPLLAEIEATAQELRAERGRESRADMGKEVALEAQLDSLQKAARAYVDPNPYDKIYTENGGQGFNAGTSWDGTNYEVALPSNRLELWMKIESDRLKGPVLREFYTELGNIMEERRLRTEDEPGGPLGKLGETMYSTAYTAHRYGVPIIGWPSDILHVTRTEVESFFKKYYAPNRITLGIVGDIDPDKTFRWANAYFGPIPRQTDPWPPRTVEPTQRGERRYTIEYDAESRVMIAWHITDGLDRDYPAITMLDYVLTKGRSSRLVNEVIEKGKVASSVNGYTGLPGERYPGLYLLEATPLAPHTTEEVETAIYDQVERIKKEPPTDEELAAAKLRFRKEFVQGLIDNLGLAKILAYNNATLGDWREAFHRAEAVAAVTPTDLQRVAATYLTRSNRTVGTLIKPVVETAFVDQSAAAGAANLLKEARAALGGDPALDAVKNVQTEATLAIDTGGQSLPANETQTMTVDGKFRSEMSVMGRSQVQVLTGDSGWISGPAGAQDAPPDAVEEMKEGLARDFYLFRNRPDAPDGTLRALPDGVFQGMKAQLLEITPSTGKPFILYLDPDSHRPLGCSYDSQNPMTQKSGRAEEVYSEWKESGGVVWPTKTDLYIGGSKLVSKTITRRAVNAGIDPSMFAKPS